jgi:ubiquinone biosynthesis protein
MVLSLRPRSLKRYKDIARLLFKYGRSDLLRDTGLDAALDGEDGLRTSCALAEELAADLERMGPTYVKLGQLLSTRGDLLPAAVVEALSRLQDRVEPIPAEDVRKIIESELGCRMSKAFQDFDLEPLASASLGQVHRAILRDGRAVVVKAQRPGIRERILEDVDALRGVAGLLDGHTEAGRRYRFTSMVDEFHRTILRELDYRQEARNLVTLAENLKEYELLFVPRPVEGYTTARVLTMDHVRGRKVTELGPVPLSELDGPALVDQLVKAYLKQVLLDGFVHADPHPGNILVTDDGRLALIDLGMVARIPGETQKALLSLMLAIAEGRGDDAAGAALDLARVPTREDEQELRKRIADLVGQTAEARLADLEVGRMLVQIARAVADCGLRLPAEIGVVGQTLLKLDSVARILAPEYRPNQAILGRARETMRERFFRDLSFSALFKGAVELKDFAARLPGRLSRLLDAAARNELGIHVDAIDEERLIEGLQKIANRITVGLILAALIVGAALLMRVDTPYRILGYPAPAALLFLAATLGGAGLVFNILLRDRPPRSHRH